MQKIVLLGTGMVGSAMARDLCDDFDLVVADLDKERLSRLQQQGKMQTVQADLGDKKTVGNIVEKADLVIGAVPGSMGFNTVKTVIEAGKNMVDISFFEEDPFLLDDLAREKGVTVVTDCGVAPGMSNIMMGYYNTTMEVQSFRCLVGGLPKTRVWPYEYKAPFSPIDVIAEYTRPARFREQGRLVVKPALSDPELIDFEGIGTLEAFNTDGLRSLLHTMKAPDMIEKTLRYPGHIEKMRILRESGFFKEDPMDVNGASVRPLDLTTRLLFPIWKLEKDEAEFTVMRIEIEGQRNGKPLRVLCRLYDEYDPESGLSSMARTTGYPCTGTARLVLKGTYRRPGISPPEYVGAEPACFKELLTYQRQRKVMYRIDEVPRP